MSGIMVDGRVQLHSFIGYRSESNVDVEHMLLSCKFCGMSEQHIVHDWENPDWVDPTEIEETVDSLKETEYIVQDLEEQLEEHREAVETLEQIRELV
jgi:septal ring factor EnvC (AmiA/AmiB activator)